MPDILRGRPHVAPMDSAEAATIDPRPSVKGRWARSLVGLVCAAVSIGTTCTRQPPPTAMPVDVANLPRPSAADWNTFAWESFVASNWPVAPEGRGLPDPAQRIGATDSSGVSVPVVWMTSKGVSDVFLPKGAPPDPNWQTQVPVDACRSQRSYDSASSYVLGMVAKGHPAAYTALDQAPFPGSKLVIGPLIDQAGNYVRYDIRMSQSEFSYFLNYKYYNAAEQIAAVTKDPPAFYAPPKSGKESYLQNLPPSARYGAVEYKASWRVLNPNVDIVSRYFTASAFFVNPDGTCEGPRLMGLTGLHILRLTESTPATWFWATFEQVDNLRVPNPPPTRPTGQPLTPTFGDGKKVFPAGYRDMPKPVQPGKPLPPLPPVDVSRVIPIQSDSMAVTQSYQRTLAKTVWQHYELVGVQFPVSPMVNGQPQGTAQGKGQCYVAGIDHDTQPEFQLNDCYLANVSMETYVQSTSCATCHSYGAPQGVGRTSRGRPKFDALVKFQIFTFMLLQAQSP